MSRLELSRRVLLAAARSALAVPADEVSEVDHLWPDVEGAWPSLTAAMGSQEASTVDPLHNRLSRELGLRLLDGWLVSLCLAVEVFPDAAAAASLLAEEERLSLMTPVTFARIAQQTLGVSYVEALGVALEGGEPRHLGLLEVVDLLPGTPVTHRGLRIAPRELPGLLGVVSSLAASLEEASSEVSSSGRLSSQASSSGVASSRSWDARGRIWVEREEPATGKAFPESVIAGAAGVLHQRGLLCLRASSRRGAQQMALDIATHRRQQALFIRTEEELPSAAELARLGEGLPVIDLIERDSSPAKELGLLRDLASLESTCVALVPASAELGRFASWPVPAMGFQQAEAVWRLSGQSREVAQSLAQRFRLSLPEVRSVVRETKSLQNGAAPVTQDREGTSPSGESAPSSLAGSSLAGSSLAGSSVAGTRQSGSTTQHDSAQNGPSLNGADLNGMVSSRNGSGGTVSSCDVLDRDVLDRDVLNRDVLNRDVSSGAESDPAVLGRAVLEQGARRMGKLVTHLSSDARLDQLVLPPRQRRQLDDVIGWYEASSRVFGEMGMHPTSHLGRGLVCLFSGPPGTGKTFSAQCLAERLGLNLYRIDLSQVVSKYIGETEKALSTVFDEAEAGHGLLLFDEADALFGKRSSVKDAHDRYANIEVGYLLQRLESFAGVAILATNLRSNMDQAFVRRIRFLLDFPMPDRPMRHLLWEQALPRPSYRAEDLQVEPLIERFRLSGGSIQNIGLAAAHLAASTPSGRVSTEHLVRATYRELEKTGQARSKADFGPLADCLEEAV